MIRLYDLYSADLQRRFFFNRKRRTLPTLSGTGHILFSKDGDSSQVGNSIVDSDDGEESSSYDKSVFSTSELPLSSLSAFLKQKNMTVPDA